MPDFSPLLRYFAGEKQAAIVCFALGFVAVLFSIWLWRSGHAFRTMALPLALVGLVQLGIGIGLMTRTDAQVQKLTEGLLATPAEAARAELERMERVNRAFVMIEWGELALILVGLALIFAFKARPLWSGIGAGLVVQAAAMLVFDLFAEHRALIYTEWIRKL